jgi:quercetin dioxygenase-like cupin family protein|tara:strand:+ start:1905 stop:2573 length:669 start_codon:yes stop_codon:yes gene_type:complete
MKGMLNIENGETYKVRDVWSYDVTVSKDSVQYLGDEFEGTSYLMGKNCDIDVKEGYTIHRGDFAGQIGKEFLVSGETFAHIKFYGLSMNDDRLFIPHGLPKGNLSYMDGGTNTTAVNPGRLGLPVINYVHFPAGMSQTLHTHPSQRIGLILSGKGEIELDNGVMFPIKAGDCWVMDRNVLHNFMCNKGEDVTLFVFSPDSGTGPTDEINPLKVRTYVGQTRV